MLEPVNDSGPVMVIEFALFAKVIALPDVLSNVPVRLRFPAPIAAALPRFNVPADTVNPPVNVFAPFSVSVPVLVFVMALPVAPSAITPPITTAGPETEMLRTAPAPEPRETSPEPRFRVVPVESVKLPFQTC